jgi:D-alanyl-D-alanine carboxypeptidase/D-alanyl-D-alanine-endopeptidase (penicillin-binding protein 4)
MVLIKATGLLCCVLKTPRKFMSQTVSRLLGLKSRLVVVLLTLLTAGHPLGAQAETASKITIADPEIAPPSPATLRALKTSCPTALSQRAQSVLNRPQVAAKGWGVEVASLTQDIVLFSHNADRYFIPASNTKLLTTAAALQTYGPEHRIGSKSLLEWVNVVNTYSNNYSADVLLRHLGGPRAVQETLAPLGINPQKYRQRDGSGLSRANLATPDTLVNVLKQMSHSRNWAVFYYSLPSAGQSGTLINRLKAPEVQGKVRAKTGTLSGVRALSGYLQHPEYGTLVFSILVNQSSQPGPVLVQTIDELVLSMARSHPCTPNPTIF